LSPPRVDRRSETPSARFAEHLPQIRQGIRPLTTKILLSHLGEAGGGHPSLGRFTSPDSIVPTSTQGTQAWDRYAFVNNNPVRFNDPTGHCIDGITTLFCAAAGAALGGALIGAGMYIITQSLAGEKISGGDLALATAVGAASAAAITVGVMTANPVLTGAGIGAAYGAVSDMAGDIVAGDGFDTSDFAISVAGNAIGGAMLPWSGAPVNMFTAGLVGAGVNVNVYMFQEEANGESFTIEGQLWAMGTGAAGGAIDGIPSSSSSGTAIRTVLSQVIQNLPLPDNCEETEYICP